MTDGEALLRAVLANPEEDTPRLVYADWLEENGDAPRARFIRWQIECESRRSFQHPFPPVSFRKWFAPWWRGKTCWRRLAWDDRPSLVLMRVRSESDPWVDQMIVRRGFVEEVRIPLVMYELFAAEVFQRSPITRVKLSDLAPHTGTFYRDNEPDWHLNGKRYWLWNVPVENSFARYYVPAEILVEMPNGIEPWSGYRQYLSEREAWDALSIGCVAVGRRRAAKLQEVTA